MLLLTLSRCVLLLLWSSPANTRQVHSIQLLAGPASGLHHLGSAALWRVLQEQQAHLHPADGHARPVLRRRGPADGVRHALHCSLCSWQQQASSTQRSTISSRRAADSALSLLPVLSQCARSCSCRATALALALALARLLLLQHACSCSCPCSCPCSCSCTCSCPCACT